MTTTNKEDGPYQVARTGLHVKLERIVLQIDRGAEANQDSTYAQGYNECNKAEKDLLKDRSTCVLNSYWMVQCYQGSRTRHYDEPTMFTFSIVKRFYQIIKTRTMVGEMVFIREESIV
jgi:hypothetical protein